MQERDTHRPWTLADQVSTYRFWALAIAWVCIAFSMHALQTGAMAGMRSSMGYTEIAQVMAIGLPVGAALGIVLGLLLVRAHTVPGLLLTALLCGVLLPLGLDWGAVEPSVPVLALSLLAGQVLVFSFMVVVPAVLAGGRGGSVAFASAFAVALLLKAAVDVSAPAAVVYIGHAWPELSRQWLSVGAVLLAMALLLPLLRPAARRLFNGAPLARHVPLAPRYRSPVAVALGVGLLWLAVLILLWAVWRHMAYNPLPGGNRLWTGIATVLAVAGLARLVHWNYRIHGEVAALAPSSELLTPRAAAWASVLMPLAVLLLPLQLAVVLQRQQKVPLSTGWVVFWCLLLPPVALALVQRAVNQAAQSAR